MRKSQAAEGRPSELESVKGVQCLQKDLLRNVFCFCALPNSRSRVPVHPEVVRLVHLTKGC